MCEDGVGLAVEPSPTIRSSTGRYGHGLPLPRSLAGSSAADAPITGIRTGDFELLRVHFREPSVPLPRRFAGVSSFPTFAGLMAGGREKPRERRVEDGQEEGRDRLPRRGTHAAFTWGVLTEILRMKKTWDASPDEAEKFDIVAISGTSAGALCAMATWYGLVPNTADPGWARLIRRSNAWTFCGPPLPRRPGRDRPQSDGRLPLPLEMKGAPFPGSNPSDVYGNLGLAGLLMMDARREYLSFRPFSARCAPISQPSTGPEWRNLGHSHKSTGILSAHIENRPRRHQGPGE